MAKQIPLVLLALHDPVFGLGDEDQLFGSLLLV